MFYLNRRAHVPQKYGLLCTFDFRPGLLKRARAFTPNVKSGRLLSRGYTFMNRTTYSGFLNISLRSKKQYMRECGRIKKQLSPITKSGLLNNYPVKVVKYSKIENLRVNIYGHFSKKENSLYLSISRALRRKE